jgi:uncharacterized repeat protein (TIGR02543 family)
VKRWHVGEKNSHSWALVGMLIVLFLVQLLIMPSAVHAVGASVWVERMPAGNVNGNWLACASDATGQRLVAGDNGGRLWISADSGTNWAETGVPAGGMGRYWQECASDADGSTVLAGVYGGRLYRSTNFGASWTAAAPGGLTDQNWKAVASDADGSTLIAGVYAKRLWLSTNGGVGWSELRPAGNADQTWQAIACDATGLHLMVLTRNGLSYVSADGGVTWKETRPGGSATPPWKACAMDADGSTLVVTAYPGRLYRSVDAGTTWTELRPLGDVDRNWQAVAVDADGFHIVAVVDGGSVWTSSDGGTTWSDVQPAGVTAAAWQCCASSADGSRLVAGAYQGRLYIGLATWSLSYACTAGGVITGATSQTVNQGANSTAVTATPNGGYHFVSWSDGSTVNPRTDVNVTADISVTSIFAVDTFDITASAGANGSIDPSGSVSVNYGSTQSFTINPITGYHVLDVLVDGGSVGAVSSYAFTNVTANHTVAASFGTNSYVLTADATGSGSISKSPDQTSYDHGISIQLTATPATYWHFVGWSGDLTSSGNPATVTIDGNKTITATFAIDTFTVTPSAGSNGSISPATPQTMDYDGNLTFIMTPNTGYHVQDVFVDTVSVGAVTSYTFTNLPENHTIAVTFAINPITISTYTVTYTAGANGTISGTSPQTVNQGASSTAVTATPNGGYHFVSWSDGSLTAARTDTNVTVNVDVSASFGININIHRYTLTANVSGSGSVAKSPDQPSYTHGTSVQLMATPATGWHFVGWSGDLAGTTNPVTITMDVSKTVTATYAPVALFPVSPRHTMVLTIDIKTMTVDSARVVLDAPAAIVEDRTLVPLRAVVEHLGGSIVWDAKTRQVTLKARGTTITLTIGKSTALVNGKSLAIDLKNSKVVPVLSSSRTMLPLRFVSENLGLQVEWNAETRTITVNWED